MKKLILPLILVCCFFCLKVCCQANNPAHSGNNYDNNSKLYNIARQKWVDFGHTGNWDSCFFYARKVQQIAEADFGRMSSKNAETMAMVLGVSYYNFRDYIKAYNFTKQGVSIFLAINDTSSTQYIDALNNLGGICEAIGSYSEGEAYLLKCSDICKRLGNSFNFYQSSISRALIYDDIGEYSKAELVYADLKG